MSPEVCDLAELQFIYRWNVKAGIKYRDDVNYGHFEHHIIERMRLLWLKHGDLFEEELFPEWFVATQDTKESFGFQYFLGQDEVYRRLQEHLLKLQEDDEDDEMEEGNDNDEDQDNEDDERFSNVQMLAILSKLGISDQRLRQSARYFESECQSVPCSMDSILRIYRDITFEHRTNSDSQHSRSDEIDATQTLLKLFHD